MWATGRGEEASEARERARAYRSKAQEGADPIAERLAAISAAAAERSAMQTFAKTAEQYIFSRSVVGWLIAPRE